MKIRKNNLFMFLLGAFALIILIAFAINTFYEKRRESNLYNIGNLQEIKEELVLPSVAIFNEYILDNFEGIEVKTDNTVFRADSVIENTASLDATKNAEQLLIIANNESANLSTKLPDYHDLKSYIFEDDTNNLNINYFTTINDDLNFYNKEKKYLENYVNYKSIKIDESGYLINYADGYESLLNINNKNIDWDILKNSNNINLHSSLKFVDNKIYSLYSYIEDLSNIDKSKLLSSYISIDDIEYRSTFMGIDFINNGYLLKFNLFDRIEKLLSDRFIDIKLTLNTESGYSIPKSSVINKHNQDGVYFLDNNVITFTPIKILKDEGDNYLISNNISLIYPDIISEDIVSFKTLDPFSKIIINPDNYEEGNIY